MAEKNNINLASALFINGLVTSIDDAKANISNHVRWVRTNMPNLSLNSANVGVYTVDEMAFKKALSAYYAEKRIKTDKKRQAAIALNERMKREKADGLRNPQGKVIRPSPQVENPYLRFSCDDWAGLDLPKDAATAQLMLQAHADFVKQKKPRYSAKAVLARKKALITIAFSGEAAN